MNTEVPYAKRKWAEKLGVSTSGYYKWRYDRHRRQAVDELGVRKLKLCSAKVKVFMASTGFVAFSGVMVARHPIRSLNASWRKKA
jgi:hypothetical protein